MSEALTQSNLRIVEDLYEKYQNLLASPETAAKFTWQDAIRDIDYIRMQVDSPELALLRSELFQHRREKYILIIFTLICVGAFVSALSKVISHEDSSLDFLFAAAMTPFLTILYLPLKHNDPLLMEKLKGVHRGEPIENLRRLMLASSEPDTEI